MTIPDHLIQASNAALSDETVDWVTTAGELNTEEVSRGVLTAAFAALPDCEEVQAIRVALVDVYGSVAAEGAPPSTGAVFDAVIGTLAKSFGARP